MKKRWFKPRFSTSKGERERKRERDPTYDFVLLAIPDRSAEQTLYLVAGVIWVFTLPEDKGDKGDNYSLWGK